MIRFPWISRRAAEDQRLDAERRANQLDSVARHYRRENARLRVALSLLATSSAIDE